MFPVSSCSSLCSIHFLLMFLLFLLFLFLATFCAVTIFACCVSSWDHFQEPRHGSVVEDMFSGKFENQTWICKKNLYFFLDLPEISGDLTGLHGSASSPEIFMFQNWKFQHIGGETKWPLYCRWCFQTDILVWNLLHFHSNFTEFCFNEHYVSLCQPSSELLMA